MFLCKEKVLLYRCLYVQPKKGEYTLYAIYLFNFKTKNLYIKYKYVCKTKKFKLMLI